MGVNIDPALVIEHMQKQAQESEVVKFALDAAMRQAVLVDKDRTLDAMERALEQEKRKVRELQEEISHDAKRSAEAGRPVDGHAAQGKQVGDGRGATDEQPGGPKILRPASAAGK